MLRKIVIFISGLALVSALAAAMAWAFAPQTTNAAEIDQVINEVAAAQDKPNRPNDRQVAEKTLVVALINQTSQLTGLSHQEVVDAIAAGKSLAEVATANGSSADAVIKAVSDKAKERLDQQVKNGHMSQARADELLKRLQTKASELMNDTSLGTQVAERQAQLLKLKVMPALIRSAAESTGLPVGDITGRLRDGESLTEIVTSAGGNINTVVDAATADFRSAAEEAVK